MELQTAKRGFGRAARSLAWLLAVSLAAQSTAFATSGAEQANLVKAQLSRVKPGHTVSVWMDNNIKVRGEVVSVDADTFSIQPAQGSAPVVLPYANVRRFDSHSKKFWIATIVGFSALYAGLGYAQSQCRTNCGGGYGGY